MLTSVLPAFLRFGHTYISHEAPVIHWSRGHLSCVAIPRVCRYIQVHHLEDELKNLHRDTRNKKHQLETEKKQLAIARDRKLQVWKASTISGWMNNNITYHFFVFVCFSARALVGMLLCLSSSRAACCVCIPETADGENGKAAGRERPACETPQSRQQAESTSFTVTCCLVPEHILSLPQLQKKACWHHTWHHHAYRLACFNHFFCNCRNSQHLDLERRNWLPKRNRRWTR